MLRRGRRTDIASTLILGRGDVRDLLGLDEAIAAVEQAFRLHAEGRSLAPAVLGVPADEGGFHVKAAGLRLARTYFAAKVNGNFPSNPRRWGLPAIQGVIVLCDAGNGSPLAVLDSMEVTALRTAAATAVAARHLARPDSTIATICGCGAQGRAQLRALCRVLPIAQVQAFDLDPAAAAAFAEELTLELGIEVRAAADLRDAVRRSDLCVTCTPSRRPFLGAGDVPPGAFVAAVGADSPEKQELEPKLMAAATVVVDVLEQCATIGELRHALETGDLRREDVHAELGEIVAGRRPGRRSRDEVVVFDSTGTALQDVAAAAAVYEKAVRLGRGRAVDFSQ